MNKETLAALDKVLQYLAGIIGTNQEEDHTELYKNFRKLDEYYQAQKNIMI